MSNCFRWLIVAGALFGVLSAPRGAGAQGNPDPASFRFNTGQNVQPIFEGWAKNADGTFAMHFGYINRNFAEALEIPVGPDNKIEPGTADRGQPTFFNPRIHRLTFKVTVPKDWGKKELVWTLTVRGKTEQAVAWLQPEWEIDPINGGKTLTEEQKKNTAPKMTLNVPATVPLADPVTLTAAVQDDGLPTPPKGPRKQAIGQETPPTLKPLPDQAEIPVNVPELEGFNPARGRGGPQGLVMKWVVWRGPAAVTFDAPVTPVKDGKAVVTATFTKPGTYVLRGRAEDGMLFDEKDVTVAVH